MRVKIYANLENLASEQIYAFIIYAFLSIKIKQHLLLLTDYRYISILVSVSPYGSSLFSGKHRVSLTLSRLRLCCTSRRTATFADCVTTSPSCVSLTVGKEFASWK